MKNIKAITVFCGSHLGEDQSFTNEAEKLGKLLAFNNITVVFGGSSNGLMGILADATIQNGGKCIGVIPRSLTKIENAETNLTELIWTETIGERKTKMLTLADAFVVLPGGFGTMDELFEVLVNDQIGEFNKQVYLFNFNNYYHHLIEFIKVGAQSGFIPASSIQYLTVINSIEDLEKELNAPILAQSN